MYNVMVLGGALERHLGHEGETLMSEISIFIFIF